MLKIELCDTFYLRHIKGVSVHMAWLLQGYRNLTLSYFIEGLLEVYFMQ